MRLTSSRRAYLSAPPCSFLTWRRSTSHGTRGSGCRLLARSGPPPPQKVRRARGEGPYHGRGAVWRPNASNVLAHSVHRRHLRVWHRQKRSTQVTAGPRRRRRRHGTCHHPAQQTLTRLNVLARGGDPNAIHYLAHRLGNDYCRCGEPTHRSGRASELAKCAPRGLAHSKRRRRRRRRRIRRDRQTSTTAGHQRARGNLARSVNCTALVGHELHRRACLRPNGLSHFERQRAWCARGARRLRPAQPQQAS